MRLLSNPRPESYWSDIRSAPPRSILFGHGFHSDEPYIHDFYDYVTKQKEDERVDHEIIDEELWERRQRLLDSRENLSTTAPNPFGTRGQRKLAAYCMRALVYDLVIHPHGTPPGGEAVVYGPHATPAVKSTASYLGAKRAIVRYEPMEILLRQSMILEMSPEGGILSPEHIHERLTALMDEPTLPRPDELEEYVYIGDLTEASASEMGLKGKYESFEPLTRHDSEALYQKLGGSGLDLIAYSWDAERFVGTGYRGELLARAPMPRNHPRAGQRHTVI